MKAHELREKRARLLEEARQVLLGAESENRELTSEEDAKFATIHAEAERCRKAAVLLETQEAAEADQLQADELRRRAAASRPVEGPDADAIRETYGRWMRWGMHALDYEERRVMAGRMFAVTDAMRAEMRVMGTDATGTPYGGYQIPEAYQREIDSARIQQGGMEEASRLLPTTSGAALPWPTDDDTANVGELLAEGNAAAELDVVMGRVVFGAYTYSSKMVKVQMQLLQDSAFDIGAFLREKFVERLQRITNSHYTTGTGSAQPNGVITAADDSTITPSAGTGLTRANLIDIMLSVNRTYRPNARWMMHDTTLGTIMKLALGSADDRPLYKGGDARTGEPETIEGKPFSVNNDMATDAAATNVALAFGDFKKYIIRKVQPNILLRLEERYAEYLQVAFLMFSREDGDLVNTAAVKTATMTT